MELLSRKEGLVLLAVWRLQDEAYGAGIRDFLVEETGEEFSVGIIYSVLHRLASAGYLRTRIGEPTPERGGRAKRYFYLTGEGVAALRRTRRVEEALWADLPTIAAAQGG